MAVDMRREAQHIRNEFTRYHRAIGESVMWFCFDQQHSHYDRVYDEGYRRYEQARKVPVLWIDQMEANEDYAPEGRRPTQRLRFAVSARELFETGISVTEAHGERIWDQSQNPVWNSDRLDDLLYYDGRFYEVSNFQIRGRLQDQDMIIGVSGIETKPADELNLDTVPLGWFPPKPLADVTTAEPQRVTYGPTEPTDPEVGDIWLDTD